MSGVIVTDGRNRWPVPHGVDPVDVLAEHGLAGEPVRAVRDADDLIELRYAISGREARGPTATTEEHHVRRVQRLGAYAVVVDAGRLLLSQLSERVPGAGGLWSLPGGGIEPREEPEAAVVREVLEETGQDVLVGDLAQVQSAHWVGPNAAGVEENFHAMRLVHHAHCPNPTAARVMEVDGSTGAAAWVPVDEVPDLPLTGMVEEALHLVTR